MLRDSRLLSAVVLGVGLVLYAVLAVASMRHESANFDEPIHLVPGYMALTRGDFWVEPYHPPLPRVLAAAPLLLLDVRVNDEAPALRQRRSWAFVQQFLFRWNDAERLLFWARLPIVALGLAAAAAVFFFTRRRWGLPPAALALLLCVLNPEMLAHGRVVTTDLAGALFIFLAVAAGERLAETVTWPRLLAAGFALGAALVSKFSSVGLGLILALLAVAVALSARPWPVRLTGRKGEVREVATRAGRLLLAFALLASMAAMAVGVVWAFHGFRVAPGEEPAVRSAFPWTAVEPGTPLVREGMAWARRLHLVPDPWLYGLSEVLTGRHARPAFLLGQVSEHGWWYYFPVAFALKTPLPLLLLLGWLLLRLVLRRRRARDSWRRELFLWLPPLLFAALAMTQRVNIGLRHLLPVYPFLFAAAGRCAAGVEETPRRPRTRLRLAAVGVLAAWYAVSTLRVYPHFLTYFNEAAGGPANGYRLLVDSNLDWGQGLKALREYMTANGTPRLELCYFGSADPDAYGVAADRLPGYLPPPRGRLARRVKRGDLVAVSATHLQGLYLDPRLVPLMAKLRAQAPAAVVANSILVYRADFDWTLPPRAGRRKPIG